jgi:predicted dehydrogenase
MTKKVGVGVIGCGTISGIYLKNLSQIFHNVDVIACADLILERAKDRSKEFNISKVYSVEELLNDPDIQIVLNLTIPKAHAEVSLSALKAGKNVYAEKPMAINTEDGKTILKLARENKLLVGGAPDTFLGGGIQTCRKLIDDGWIGEPIGATAFMLCHGHESWHPDPEFYYKFGGGPMFDMGPYYLTALINLIGPVKKVSGATKISFPERTITSQPRYGTKIKVDVPTHIAGIMEFANGAIGTIITSFDVWNTKLPHMEIYGTEGTLLVPDPNTFGGPIYLQRMNSSEWSEIPLTHNYIENSRGIGVADMAYTLISGRLHRANGELTYHVLEIMNGFHVSASTGEHYTLKSTCKRPEPLPMGLLKGTLDE